MLSVSLNKTFPSFLPVQSKLFFDDGKERSGVDRNRLFITFNYQLTALDMKVEIKDRIMSHEKPVVAALYNTVYNQVCNALIQETKPYQQIKNVSLHGLSQRDV